MENTTANIVNSQYEMYPYPHRVPEDEKVNLIATHMDELNVLNSIGFKGNANYKQFKVLVAGGGTGSATIYLAEQLRNFPNAKVIYCDLSKASMKIAQQRADIRKLSNIVWLNQSFLDIDRSAYQFDFITCCGVLHHLEDPDFGLRCLKELLKPEGIMSIMLYAKAGRTAIYQIQKLLKSITSDKHDLEEKIGITRDIIDKLPKTNWWNHCKEFITDFNSGDDASIVDLFLHAQDRAYSIRELYKFIADSDLKLIDFVMPGRYYLLPEAYGICEELSNLIYEHPQSTQQAIMELMAGNITKHTFYLSKTTNTRAKPSDNNNIPYYNRTKINGEDLAFNIESRNCKNITIKANNKYSSNITIGKYTTELLRRINGEKTIGEIYSEINDKFENKVDASALKLDFESLYNELNKFDTMLLRNHMSEIIPSPDEIQSSFINSLKT